MKKLLFIFFLTLAFAFPSEAQRTPYVILISFDAFRWDYVNRGLTPNLDIMEKEGVSALSLRPSFPSKTFPNHISIITGMYPEHHGIISNTIYDPFRKAVYRMGDTAAVRDARWYQGEAFWETAERQGIKTASYFWPGSEVHIPYRHPSYFQEYEHTRPYDERINGIINWLQLPYADRPHFITGYFHETDAAGHNYGPNSARTDTAIKVLDNIVGLLFRKLDEIKMKDSVNVIILSDHGMTEVSKDRMIFADKILAGIECRFQDDGPLMQITPGDGEIDKAFNLLKANENHYKVYLKKDLPEFYHYNEHPFIGPIILVADLGWSLVTTNRSSWLDKSKGNHGYDNNNTDMQGIFIAEGPAFKSGYKTGTLWNIDVYPLLCKIFNVTPRSNIDGKAERIEFLLK